MKKIKLTKIIKKEESKNLGAPLVFLEGDKYKDNMSNNVLLISSKMESDFYRSVASVAYSFYKPISKI